MENKIVIANGKRKQAVARANIRKGKGKVRINGIPLSEYLPLMFRQKIEEPILIAGDLSNSIDIDVNIKGVLYCTVRSNRGSKIGNCERTGGVFRFR